MDQWSRRFRILILIILLFSQADAAIPRTLAPAIDALSETIASHSRDMTDDALRDIGYDRRYTSAFVDWERLSSYQRIETMALAAERSVPGSAESALALMAKNHAQQYPAVLDEPAIVAISSKASAGHPTFANLTAPSKRRLAPSVSAAIDAIANHVNTGTMTVSTLLSRSGTPPAAIKRIVREHRDVRAAFNAAVSRAGTREKQEAFTARLIHHACRQYPALRENKDVKAFQVSLASKGSAGFGHHGKIHLTERMGPKKTPPHEDPNHRKAGEHRAPGERPRPDGAHHKPGNHQLLHPHH